MDDLVIIPEKWNAQAAIYLDAACDERYTINDLAYDVNRGECSLFNVYDADKTHVGSMVLRMDVCAAGSKELVVVALGGKHGRSLIQSLSDFWDDLAIKNKAQSVRAHVSKKGMARLMERVGGVLTESVYRRAVPYGR